MLKVVIDTNSLIDADSDEYNYSNRIIDEVIAGNIEAYANRATMRENKLITPRKLQDPSFLNKLNYYFQAVRSVETGPRLQAIADDPEDNKILESALSSDADYLITSDHHLLKLEKFQSVKIVTPTQFWNIYEEGTESGWLKWIQNFIN